MWFLLRIIVALTSFCIRYYRAHIKIPVGKVDKELEGTRFTVMPLKAKNRGVIRTVVEFPFKTKSIFKLSYETPMDRLFKKIGLANEFQTGDHIFDDSFYIASDNPQFWSLLQSHPKTRDEIAILFKRDLMAIESDGTNLRFDFNSDQSLDTDKHKACHSVYKALTKEPVGLPQFFTESFTPKILFIEAFIWALASYAMTAVFEFIVAREQVNLERARLISSGLNLGAAVAVALVLMIFILLRGSSRGHRIIIESAVVLGISFPIAGPAVISDINIYLDKSAAQIVEADVIQTYIQESRRRRRNSTKYYLQSRVSSGWTGVEIPSPMEISSGTFYELQNVKKVKFAIKKGRLGFWWNESIKPIY